jgi:transcriptional regulator with XRE-family HTH domain
MDDVGRAVKKIRMQRGMSQVALAKRTGLTQGYIAKLESAAYDTNPSVDVALRLAKALGVEIGALVKPRARKRTPS